MKIPQFKPFIGKEEYEQIKECFDNNWVTEGKKSKEFVKYKIHIKDNIDLEKSIIDEHSDNINIDFLNTDNKSALIKTLINSLNTNKIEGEKINNFEERIFDELTNILEIE